jgi:CcmD family protein
MKKLVSLMLLNIMWLNATFGQGESLDFLRSTGKIYSVVVVILAIFIGIAVFLYRIDRKLTKLEKQINNEQ